MTRKQYNTVKVKGLADWRCFEIRNKFYNKVVNLPDVIISRFILLRSQVLSLNKFFRASYKSAWVKLENKYYIISISMKLNSVYGIGLSAY